MICLDANYLIGSVVGGSAESQKIIHWLDTGEVLITPMPAWYEFLCGPVSGEQVAVVRSILTEIVPREEAHVVEAARLFNLAGRKRGLRSDALIAACAILKDALLATQNTSDFECFEPFGLRSSL